MFGLVKNAANKVGNMLNPVGWYRWAVGAEAREHRARHAVVMQDLVATLHEPALRMKFAPVVAQLNQTKARQQFDSVMQELMVKRRREDFKPVADELHRVHHERNQRQYLNEHHKKFAPVMKELTEQAKQNRINQFFSKATVSKAINIGLTALGTAMLVAGVAACLTGAGFGAGALLMTMGQTLLSGFAALGFANTAATVASAGVAVLGAGFAGNALKNLGVFAPTNKKVASFMAAKTAEAGVEEQARPAVRAM